MQTYVQESGRMITSLFNCKLTLLHICNKSTELHEVFYRWQQNNQMFIA